LTHRTVKIKKIKIQNGGNRHLAKSKNRHMSATVLPIAMKFSILTQLNPLEATVKFNFFKSKMATAAILKNRNRHISAVVGPIATTFGTLTQFNPDER